MRAGHLKEHLLKHEVSCHTEKGSFSILHSKYIEASIIGFYIEKHAPLVVHTGGPKQEFTLLEKRLFCLAWKFTE